MSNFELESIIKIILNNDNPVNQQLLERQLQEVKSPKVLQEEQLQVPTYDIN